VSPMLKALASPVRLELLQLLQSPRMLGEIRLRPGRSDRAGMPGRSLSRVTVRQHLDSLLKIGAVQVVPLLRDGRLLNHFVVDHRQLFALTEELRQLARIRPEGDLLPDGTRPGPGHAAAAVQGPRLALVNGAREGQWFPLESGGGQDASWLIGRRPGADILLDYDPYVSVENTQVLRRGDAFSIVDLPASRNGTLLNWETVPKGRPQPLANGDVVGVGRSTLVFRE
ncbi:MAG: FHA domain-containing protein, partial [Halobacteriales archaeon]|nr:FHA domain-containing protein [Halobacteriales archaeon]